MSEEVYGEFAHRIRYRNMREAFQELAKDLLNACYYKDDYIVDRAAELVKGLIMEYNKKLERSLQERIAYVEKKIDAIQEDTGSSAVELEPYPQMMRKIKYSKDNESICVNGMEADNKEVFIVDACDGREQFFYDGKVIKKRFISKGIVRNEVILKDKHPEYCLIIGYNKQILFDSDYYLWRYDCMKNVCQKFIDNIFNLCIYKNILFYTICDNFCQVVRDANNVRMNSSGSLWCSSFDGKVKFQLKSFGYGSGFIYITLVNDEKVSYKCVGNNNQEGSVDWKIDSFLFDNAGDNGSYTDLEITEEYKNKRKSRKKA